MTLFMAVLLGLLQGATVFLPVSASGHQAALENLFGFSPPESGYALFDFLMKLSTLVSIILVYRRELSDMLRDGVDFMRGTLQEDPLGDGRLPPTVRTIYLVLVGTLPLVLSVPINGMAGVLMGNSVFVGFSMAAMGVVLLAVDRFVRPGRKNEKKTTSRDALFVGLAQALSAVPGLSRTGLTVAAGLLRGFERDFAVKFSIFLSLPGVLVSTLIAFFSIFTDKLDLPSLLFSLVGFAVSVFVGFFCILVLRLASIKRRLRVFSLYLWAAGAAVVAAALILQA